MKAQRKRKRIKVTIVNVICNSCGNMVSKDGIKAHRELCTGKK